MKKLKKLNFLRLLFGALMIVSCGGPTQSQIEGRLYLFGQVNLQFQTDGK